MSVGPHLLVLRHGPLVGPATLVPSLDGRATQLPWREVDLDAGAPLPTLDGALGVLCLGGTMDVDDDDPWLDGERTLLADAVAAGTPVLGVCLGAQQLGLALGGRVAPLPTTHAAVVPLERTAAGREHPVVAGWADGAPALFHNGDGVVELPPGATRLLEGPTPTASAWQDASGTALAVQFHPEADLPTVEAWERRSTDTTYDREQLLARVTTAAASIRAAGVALVARWLDTAVLPRR